MSNTLSRDIVASSFGVPFQAWITAKVCFGAIRASLESEVSYIKPLSFRMK